MNNQYVGYNTSIYNKIRYKKNLFKINLTETAMNKPKMATLVQNKKDEWHPAPHDEACPRFDRRPAGTMIQITHLNRLGLESHESCPQVSAHCIAVRPHLLCRRQKRNPWRSSRVLKKTAIRIRYGDGTTMKPSIAQTWRNTNHLGQPSHGSKYSIAWLITHLKQNHQTSSQILMIPIKI